MPPLTEKPAPGSRILAVDLGGSGLKASLFTLEGEELATAARPLAFAEDEAGGSSEQDPELWWRAFAEAAEEIAGRAALDKVAAVAVCGFTRTQVLLGEGGEVLRPAIGFRDSRAASTLKALKARPELASHPRAGDLNPYHPLARLLWLKEAEPEIWARTRLVLEPKDFLNFRLTGRPASDPISLHWLIKAMGEGNPSLAEVAGIDRAPLPEILGPSTRLGAVREGLPGALGKLAGAAVFCGSNDTWTAVAGLGGLAPGRAYCISGSSEVFGVLTDRPGEAEGLITIPWQELWHLGGPGQNGSSVLSWIVDRLDLSPRPFSERLDALLAEPEHPQPLLFHPFLYGERVPFWDPDLRASFLGLGPGHGGGDLVRAVMEGVALLNRLVLERAEAAAGRTAEEIRLAGGGAKSPVWNRIRADIIGRRILVPGAREMGLSGCLALARLGLGLAEDIGSAAILGAARTYEPDPARRERADALFRLFGDTQPALAAASRRLAEIARAQS
ncbi:FGGY-family carbohydrate kinase [Afifella sp. IM 167]|uniref:xylulokinase n=1 Tax=Afifella sp. IM 167 TaxID=2033586 RepID=UPI001CCDC54A|nr:FGGY-family carbohydrate kinase [Afifella sp. IM 167]MBZ8134299.1 carbohydrate kinase [Afifella sp. IM 167]